MKTLFKKKMYRNIMDDIVTMCSYIARTQNIRKKVENKKFLGREMISVLKKNNEKECLQDELFEKYIHTYIYNREELLWRPTRPYHL